MARPAIYDDALRERLLEATAELVDRHGPDAVSLREVARAAGTSTSAIYALFGNKDALLTAVITDAFASFTAAQAAAEPAGLRQLGVAYRAWALAHPTRYRLMFGGTLSSVVPADHAADESRSPLERAVAALMPDATADERAIEVTAIWSQVHGAVSLQFTDLPLSPQSWDAAYEVILDSVTARLHA
ncbi:TetR/AcrR family transcriptional regulator [Microbacterium gorillae]|uniref:TetR/AcrR family transcriptional regulator n=1 Tax=Microbacterium gorillae TaxID=1231063 RepID=UPI00058C4BA0|nr:TetR/AcrR family transcriptional regulator [Microbacterium gorillae]